MRKGDIALAVLGRPHVQLNLQECEVHTVMKVFF